MATVYKFKNSKTSFDDFKKTKKKEMEKRKVKRILENGGGILGKYKIPAILMAVAFLLVLFVGGYLIGKIVIAAVVIAAIVYIWKNY